MYKWNNQAPTALLMGRFQPWHEGHQTLFEKALEKTGQVLIAVRDTGGVDNSNPFNYEFVRSLIVECLEPQYAGRYMVTLVPNVTNIVYGRDVGYSIDKIDLPPEIESISATKIRQQLDYRASDISQIGAQNKIA